MLFCNVKRMLTSLYEAGGEPELEIAVNGQSYMIILYGDYCTFQKCGDDCEETQYSNLDELINNALAEGVKLADIIEDIEAVSIEGCNIEEFDSILKEYQESPICKKRIEQRKKK